MDFGKILNDAAMNLVKNHEFTFKCPKCHSDVKVTMNDNGSYIQCPNCNSDIKVEVNMK